MDSESNYVKGTPASEALIKRSSIAAASWSVAMGKQCQALHYGSIMIGVGLISDRAGQLKIGTASSSVDVVLTTEQYMALRAALLNETGGF